MPGLATNTDSAAMVAHDGLNNCQAKASTARLTRVIRSEKTSALLGGEAVAGIRNFDTRGTLFVASAQVQCAARGHGVDRVENEIRECAMKQIGVGGNSQSFAPRDSRGRLSPRL